MKNLNKILLLLLALFFIFSCKRKTDKEFLKEFKFEYFPLVVGNWVIYDVDSTTYNDVDTPSIITNTIFQLKEEVSSSYYDNEGRMVYRIERTRKNDGDSVWNPFDAYYAYLTENTAEKVTDNLRFINLIFPPVKDREWKGNIYINATQELAWFADWTYIYDDIYSARNINGFNFDSTLYIIQVNDTMDDFTQMKYSSEIYAKNVGMVYKKIMHLESQQLVSKPWNQKAEEGFILEMKISDYKK